MRSADIHNLGQAKLQDILVSMMGRQNAVPLYPVWAFSNKCNTDFVDIGVFPDPERKSPFAIGLATVLGVN